MFPVQALGLTIRHGTPVSLAQTRASGVISLPFVYRTLHHSLSTLFSLHIALAHDSHSINQQVTRHSLLSDNLLAGCDAAYCPSRYRTASISIRLLTLICRTCPSRRSVSLPHPRQPTVQQVISPEFLVSKFQQCRKPLLVVISTNYLLSCRAAWAQSIISQDPSSYTATKQTNNPRHPLLKSSPTFDSSLSTSASRYAHHTHPLHIHSLRSLHVDAQLHRICRPQA